MKKKLIPLIAGTMALAITVGGCSCASSPTLSFTNGFNGGTKASTTYAETLTYNVEYVENYDSYFTKSANITDEVLGIDYNGTFVMSLNVIDRENAEIKGLDSDIVDGANDIGDNVYKLTTELNLTSNYVPGGKDENALVETEKISTISYFLSTGYSLNPIYSKTIAENVSHVSIGDDNAIEISFANYQTEVKYNQEDYLITTTMFVDVEEDGNVVTKPFKTEQECDYSYRKAIDNNTLLFALRNVDLEKDGKTYIPTIHPTYGDPQSLVINNISEHTINVNVNGVAENDVKVKEYTFVRNVQNATGSPQFVLIQKGKSNTLEDRALMLQYIAPLSLSNSYVCMGGLKYSLASIS